MKVQDIKTQLWAMANKLRGTMDASEYKNYILPFMFYRYLSDHQHQHLVENELEEFYAVTTEKELESYLSECSSILGYAIRPEHTWESVVEQIHTHKIKASTIQDLFDAFDRSVKRNQASSEEFSNLFADVNLGDSRLGGNTNERAQALYDVILMIDQFEFKDESGKDILGDVYEYLIGEFAATAGKKGGEFYTPYQVSKILAKVVTLDIDKNRKDQFKVYDPTMGSGSLLLTVQKELPNGDKMGAVQFCGQELNTTTFNLARMNLMMHGVNYRNMQLRRANTLSMDWPVIENEEGVEIPARFDAVVANPPYSQGWSADLGDDPRFKSGLAPKSKADYAFVQHCLYHLDNNGTMAIVLPHGVLFRGAAEGKIRQSIIEENMLDAVIGLPANLFYGTSIPTTVLIFKGKGKKKSKDILFIDASTMFEKAKNKNILLDGHVDEIIKMYEGRVNVDKKAYVASLDEIKENEFNLNIPRYVDTFEEEEVIPLQEIAKELKSTEEEIKKVTQELYGMLDNLVGTTPEAEKELQEFIAIFKGGNSHD